jgi:hypothetical protein
MSNATTDRRYEAAARAKKVDAIHSHLLLEAVRGGFNPYASHTAENLAAFARNADESTREALARALALATPPSPRTMAAVAKRFAVFVEPS